MKKKRHNPPIGAEGNPIPRLSFPSFLLRSKAGSTSPPPSSPGSQLREAVRACIDVSWCRATCKKNMPASPRATAPASRSTSARPRSLPHHSHCTPLALPHTPPPPIPSLAQSPPTPPPQPHLHPRARTRRRRPQIRICAPPSYCSRCDPNPCAEEIGHLDGVARARTGDKRVSVRGCSGRHRVRFELEPNIL
jgi:hypothetical protein